MQSYHARENGRWQEAKRDLRHVFGEHEDNANSLLPHHVSAAIYMAEISSIFTEFPEHEVPVKVPCGTIQIEVPSASML